MKVAVGSKVRAYVICCLMVLGAFVGMEPAKAATDSSSNFHLASVDLFAGGIFSAGSSSGSGGSSGIIGAHWTPTWAFSDTMDVKGLFGAFLLNSKADKLHAAYDYVAMLRYHMDSANLIWGMGVGGVTFANNGAVTDLQLRGSVEYSMSEAVLGVIDRFGLSSGYIFGVKANPSFIFVNGSFGIDF